MRRGWTTIRIVAESLVGIAGAGLAGEPYLDSLSYVRPTRASPFPIDLSNRSL